MYGADHPDVRRVQREIAALKADTGATGKVDTADQLKKLEAELAALKERYGDDHPDVQRLKRSIAALTAPKASPRRLTRGRQQASRRPDPDPPDNPAYIVLATQLESTKRELAQLSALRDDLRAKQRTYDARLLQIPEVEREYSELTRDYDNAQTRYREIKAKQMQAEGAVELEKDRKAERFSLGEPANLPEKPFSPNRPAIALIGLVASLGSGLGLAWLREAIDPSVKGPLELARIAPVPILTAIPYIETQREQVGKRRRTLGADWLELGGLGCLSRRRAFPGEAAAGAVRGGDAQDRDLVDRTWRRSPSPSNALWTRRRKGKTCSVRCRSAAPPSALSGSRLQTHRVHAHAECRDRAASARTPSRDLGARRHVGRRISALANAGADADATKRAGRRSP